MKYKFRLFMFAFFAVLLLVLVHHWRNPKSSADFQTVSARFIIVEHLNGAELSTKVSVFFRDPLFLPNGNEEAAQLRIKNLNIKHLGMFAKISSIAIQNQVDPCGETDVSEIRPLLARNHLNAPLIVYELPYDKYAGKTEFALRLKHTEEIGDIKMLLNDLTLEVYRDEEMNKKHLPLILSFNSPIYADENFLPNISLSKWLLYGGNFAGTDVNGNDATIKFLPDYLNPHRGSAVLRIVSQNNTITENTLEWQRSNDQITLIDTVTRQQQDIKILTCDGCDASQLESLQNSTDSVFDSGLPQMMFNFQGAWFVSQMNSC